MGNGWRVQQESQVWGAGYDVHFGCLEPEMPPEQLCKGLTDLGLR